MPYLRVGSAVILILIVVLGAIGFSYRFASKAPTAADSGWLAALGWLREETEPDAVIMTWWDYGYWVLDIAHRVPVVDNGWHSDATDRLNYGGFASSAVDSILSRLRLAQPGPSEAEWLAVLQRGVYAAQPYLFLVQGPRFAVFASRVHGARPKVVSTFWNLPEWWVEPARR